MKSIEHCYRYKKSAFGSVVLCVVRKYAGGRGVILGYKSRRSLNHAGGTLLPFRISTVSLHVYSVKQIDETESASQVDVRFQGTKMSQFEMTDKRLICIGHMKTIHTELFIRVSLIYLTLLPQSSSVNRIL